MQRWETAGGAVLEQRRQLAVDAARQTTTEREGELKRIVNQAAALARTPIASVSIIDGNRQWIAAGHGIDVPETPRSASICSRVILRPGEPLVILDAREDERYASISSVANAPFVRFYAGIPLVNRAGYALGALCVVDTVPRDEAPDLTALGRLAREAERLISG
jgi:GAF domain-containing protein